MDGHEDTMHEVLRSLGRIEAQADAAAEDRAYLRKTLDDVRGRICTVETKTAVNSSVISLATSLFVDNFKSILGVFHGS
ncbi:MAG: hypothetical protein H7829_03530 [Magnetococcus sp. THC-1_WYH]